MSRLIANSDIMAAFLNLAKLAMILALLPITTAVVELFQQHGVIKNQT